ncbi:hypothetical protein AN958_10597 [Leucoagaricus sp. SymC.cos]|nr:hypothetical protein AN958_10597 [Leucoagaricus sp. SymC.cos]
MGRYKAPYLNLSNVDSGLTSYATKKETLDPNMDKSVNDSIECAPLVADTTATKDPIREYFDHYPDFLYDPSAPVPRNFDRLVEQNGWPIGSTRFEVALAQINAALFQHFDDSIEVPGPPMEPEAGSAGHGFSAYGIESTTGDPVRECFERYRNFVYDPSESVQQQFDRLVQQNHWRIGSTRYEAALARINAALLQQYDPSYEVPELFVEPEPEPVSGGGWTSNHKVGKNARKKAKRKMKKAAAKALENAEGLEAGASDTAGTAPLQGAWVEAAADGDSKPEGFDSSVTVFVPGDAQTVPPQAKQPTASDDVHTKATTDEKLCTERLEQVDTDTTDVKPTSLSDLGEAKSDARNERGDKDAASVVSTATNDFAERVGAGTVLNPIDAFFSQYPSFDANRDRALSVATQLNQLRKQEGWWGKRYGLWVDVLEKYQEALVLQFNASYGTDAESLENWHRVLQSIGMEQPGTVEECKALLRIIYVNLVDLIDVSLKPEAQGVNCVFDSALALGTYTVSTRSAPSVADTTAAKDPIRDYFDRYPDFVYDPSAPVPRNFDRLVEQNGWPIGSTRFKAALAQIEAALFRHFDDSIEVPGPPVEHPKSAEAGSADSGFFAYGIESFATKVPRGILSESASNDIAISCTTLQNLYSNNLIGLFSKTAGLLVLLGGGWTSNHRAGKKKAKRKMKDAAKALENAEGLEAGVSDTAGTAPLQGACVEAAADGDSRLEGFDSSVTGFVPGDAQTIPPQAKQPTASDDVHTKATTDEKLCTERLEQVDADTTDVKPTSLSDLGEAKSDTRNGRGDKDVSRLFRVFTSSVRRVKREEDSDADSVQASHASDEWQVLDSSENDDNSSLHVQVVGRFTSADYDRALADIPSLANNDVINILGLHRKAWLVLRGHGPGVYQDYTSASRNAQLDPNLGVSASVRECRSIEDADRQFVHLYMRGMIQRTGPELHGTILPFQLKAQGLADSTPDDETSWWVVPLSCSPGCYFGRPTSSGEIAPSNTESTPPVVIPRTPLNPIDAFFGKYPEFDANRDRTLSVATQLNQLRKQEEWWGDRYGLWVDALEKYHEALVLQFNASYGTDAENLENWHRLLRAIGGGLRKTVYECKVIISMIYVNIVDLVDVSLDPAARPVSVVFDSVRGLSDYTVSTRKYFPKKHAAAGSLLKRLLRQDI